MIPHIAATDIKEKRAATYLESALGRCWLSTKTGEQLSMEEVQQWEMTWASLPSSIRPSWMPDPVFERAKVFYKTNEHLDVQSHKKPKAENREVDRLARDLTVVRRAKVEDVLDRMPSLDKQHLLRRQLPQEQAFLWEREFGAAWHW